MKKGGNWFSPRASGKERYKKMFLIATEGARTEPQYFALFREFDKISSVVHVKCVRRSVGASSPQHVLSAMRKYLSDRGLRKSDEAWLVVDRDEWSEKDLAVLFAWSQESENYEIALSNPKFEYWLLLHFENATSSLSSSQCSNKLRIHMPKYDERLRSSQINLASINMAVKRAQKQDNPPCDTWLTTTGTTVYRLVERILKVGD